jgi:hypothetical protein
MLGCEYRAGRLGVGGSNPLAPTKIQIKFKDLPWPYFGRAFPGKDRGSTKGPLSMKNPSRLNRRGLWSLIHRKQTFRTARIVCIGR